MFISRQNVKSIVITVDISILMEEDTERTEQDLLWIVSNELVQMGFVLDCVLEHFYKTYIHTSNSDKINTYDNIFSRELWSLLDKSLAIRWVSIRLHSRLLVIYQRGYAQ